MQILEQIIIIIIIKGTIREIFLVIIYDLLAVLYCFVLV